MEWYSFELKGETCVFRCFQYVNLIRVNFINNIPPTLAPNQVLNTQVIWFRSSIGCFTRVLATLNSDHFSQMKKLSVYFKFFKTKTYCQSDRFLLTLH